MINEIIDNTCVLTMNEIHKYSSHRCDHRHIITNSYYMPMVVVVIDVSL